LAGHSGGIDTGAICPDGLREVDITTDVAHRAKALLEARGYTVDILAEFDARLTHNQTYAPRVFLAIHADSCIYYATGYKVARADNSVIPQEDDRLTRCISLSYAAASELPFHAGSITTDMTHYHGLEEISPQSPGAIIELGFLGSNHDLLQNHRDILAQGVADGIDRYLQNDNCPQGQTGNQ
jgi:N-acetylmuramoyl-L-alanine amidase